MKNRVLIIPTLLIISGLLHFSGFGQNTLDNLDLSSSSPAQVAYSLRKLSSDYNGNVIKVRRSSDNAEATIAFWGDTLSAANSVATLTAGVTLTASLGGDETGTISTVSAKSGSISISPTKTGNITASLGSTIISGSGTSFTTEISAGDLIYKSDNTFLGVVKSVTSNTSLVLNNNTVAAHSGSFKTPKAKVTGSGTSFSTDFAVGDRIFRSSDNVYLGTVTSITDNTTMNVNALDAVAVSGIGYNGTSVTVTGSGTTFTDELKGKMLISNSITIGKVLSVQTTTSLTLTTKAGGAVSAKTFTSIDSSMTFQAFFSGTDVFVNTWYDQSGNGRDAIQTVKANQPRIVASGLLKRVNTKPAIDFPSSLSTFLRTSSAASWLANTLYTQNIVSAEVTPITTYQFVLSTTGGNGPNNTIMHYGYRSSSQYTVAQYGNDQNFEVYATSNLELHTAVKNTIGSSQMYHNGSLLGTLTSSASSHIKDLGLLSIGFYSPASNYYKGSVSELTVYALAIGAVDVAAMNSNQLAYYGISTAEWTGNTDTDWFKPGNWSNATVPTETSPSLVVIPNKTNMPVISGATDAKAINVQVQSGATLTVNSGAVLQINGTLTGTSNNCYINGTLEYISNAGQSLLGGTFFNSTVNNLKLSKTNGAVLSMSTNLNVTGDLNISSANKLLIQGFTLTINGTISGAGASAGLRGSTNSSIVVAGNAAPSLGFDQSGTYNNLKNLTISTSGVASLGSNLTLVNSGGLSFSNNGKLSIGSNTLTISGAVTNTTTGGLSGSSASNLVVDGITNRTLSFDQTTNLLNNFSVNTTSSNTITAGNAFSVNGTLTIATGQTLNMGTNALGGTLNTITNNGTLTTQNTTSTPIPTGKTWGGTVNYNSASSAQTAVSGTYNNLTISTSGGATASGDITVNGILSLAANPSATKGNLEMVTNYSDYPGTTNANPGYNNMSSYYLNMGASATTVGTGDVTGIVKRSSIVANTAYTFGNQYTTVALTDGDMPNALTVTLKIGVVPGHPETNNAVKRLFEIVPLVTDPETFTSTSRISVNFHYLDSELNGNTESKLITGDYDIEGGATSPDEHGRASYDFTNNYIGLSNVPISYFIKKSNHIWRTIFFLRDYIIDYKTWDGSESSNWSVEGNWTPSGIPQVGNFVIIPDAGTTPYDPVLPENTTINTMTIEPGGVLVMGNSTIHIQNSLSAGWEDQSGLSDPSTSTVVFDNAGATVSGTPKFYNLEIGNGAELVVASGANIRIYNELTRTGSGKWFPDIYDNTVEYAKLGDQTILTPDGTGNYHSLTLSGSGTKTLPTSALTMHGNLTTAGSVSVAPTHALNIGGNLTLGSGTTFTAGSLSHNIGGNFENNGATFTATGSTFTFNGASAQTIGGSAASTTFNDIVVSNSSASGVTSVNNINGNALTINSGSIFNVGTASDVTVSGTLTNNAGNTGLVIKSTASGTGSLLHSNAYVKGTVERYINGWDEIGGNGGWHFLSMPVVKQSIRPGFVPQDNTYPDFHQDFYKWDESSNTWINSLQTDGEWNPAFEDNFEVGKGYMVAFDVNTTKLFRDSLNVDGVSFTGLTNNGGTYAGSHLFGNPFTSAIKWGQGTWNKSNIGTYAQIWNNPAQSYRVLSGEGIIPAMNGFMVYTSGNGTLTIPADARLHADSAWYKSGDEDQIMLTAFDQDNGRYQETILRFNETGLPGFDMYEDCMFMSGYAPMLFSISENNYLALSTLPLINDETKIPLGFVKNESGNFRIVMQQTIPDKIVYLTDLVTNTAQNLTQNPVYEFSSGSSDPTNRFILRFTDAAGVSEQDIAETLTVYQSEGSIYIVTENPSDSKIMITNMLGQVEYIGKTNGMSLVVINTGNFQKGVYLISMISGSRIVSKKLILN